MNEIFVSAAVVTRLPFANAAVPLLESRTGLHAETSGASLGITLCLALTMAGAPEAAQAWLSWGISLVSAAAGLAITLRSGSPVRE